MIESIHSYKNKLKRPWIIAIIFVVLIPLFPEYIAPLLAAGSLIAAYYDNPSDYRSFQVGIFGKIILIYISYMTLGILYSPEFMSTLSTVSMWVIMFMVYLSMTTILNSRHRIDTALLAISLVAGMVGFIACVQYLFRVSLGVKIPLEFWSFIDEPIMEWLPLTLRESSNGGRASSTFSNSNIFAESMIMILPLVAYYSFYGRRMGARLTSRFCLMLAVGGVAFSFSRGSYMGLLAVALVFCIANIRKIVLLLLTMISGVLLVPQTVMTRLFTITEKDASITERLNIWTSGLSFVKTNPLFGVGAGISNSWNLLLQKGIDAPHMHNLILQLLVEGGIISLAIIAVLLWRITRSSISMLFHDNEARMTGVALLAFLVGFVTDSLVDFPFMTPKLVGIFLFLIAIAESASRLYLGNKTSSLLDVLTFKKQIVEPQSECITCSEVNSIK